MLFSQGSSSILPCPLPILTPLEVETPVRPLVLWVELCVVWAWCVDIEGSEGCDVRPWPVVVVAMEDD